MRIDENGRKFLDDVGERKPYKKQKGHGMSEEQKEKSRRKFAGTCRVCGSVLSYVHGTNVMVCKNPACKGIVQKKKNGDDEEKTEVLPVFRMLDDKGVEIASSLFAGVD